MIKNQKNPLTKTQIFNNIFENLLTKNRKFSKNIKKVFFSIFFQKHSLPKSRQLFFLMTDNSGFLRVLLHGAPNQ